MSEVNQVNQVNKLSTVTPEFIASLKAMVLEAVEKEAPAGGLGDDEPLFGPEARLDLDSLDALQVSMTIQQRFGLRMPDSKETRRALTSVAHLAEHLAAAGKA
ncbi:acyl carrier protein [Variovorax sp. OK212]|nr:acyl carrier protein [Variovorax sp. OK202]SFE43691.1 acyl carrier protein [Variovorax sp. OK212]